jgi:hypothetical protein
MARPAPLAQPRAIEKKIRQGLRGVRAILRDFVGGRGAEAVPFGYAENRAAKRTGQSHQQSRRTTPKGYRRKLLH